jgi:SAM-dependent methyltransferase
MNASRPKNRSIVNDQAEINDEVKRVSARSFYSPLSSMVKRRLFVGAKVNSNVAQVGRTIPLVEESVVESWESMPKDWPKIKFDSELVKDLKDAFQLYADSEGHDIKHVLDCGCGTGNPSIGLAKSGYSVFAVDRDASMLQTFQRNCGEAGVSVDTLLCDWRFLPQVLKSRSPFDAAICRGNSLIYAGTWENPSCSPSEARAAIEESLLSIAQMLRVGGLLYVDIMPSSEFNNSEVQVASLGVRRTNQHLIFMYWVIEHDTTRMIRRVQVRRVFESRISSLPECIKTHSYTGYLLTHIELNAIAKRCALLPIYKSIVMPSESTYQVYCFSRV